MVTTVARTSHRGNNKHFFKHFFISFSQATLPLSPADNPLEGDTTMSRLVDTVRQAIQSGNVIDKAEGVAIEEENKTATPKEREDAYKLISKADAKIDKSLKEGGHPFFNGKRERDRRIALDSGLLGKMQNHSGNVSNTFGQGGLKKGELPFTGIGEEYPLGSRPAAGTGGMGLGLGGLSKYGTVRGSGRSTGDIDLGGRGPLARATAVQSGISKDVIGDIMRRHHSEVRGAYESAVLTNPSLEGKLTVDFTIGPNGRVETATSDFKNRELANRVIDIVKGIRFPAPIGGGTVDVTYPFTFKVSGSF